jgi:hypothetical protein
MRKRQTKSPALDNRDDCPDAVRRPVAVGSRARDWRLEPNI